MLSSGCATFKKRTANALSQKANNLAQGPNNKETVLINVGFKLLEDKRPVSDISYMTSVREKVSSNILEAIKDTKIFSQINFPPSPDDEIIISGEIRKFNWNSYDTMISYIPVFNVFNLFGLPSTRTHGEVEIYLEVRDIKSDKTILSFSEQFQKGSRYNIYNFKPSKATQDLVHCFDILLEKIRQRLLLNKNIILEAVKSKPTEKPKLPQTPKPEATSQIPQTQTTDTDSTGLDKNNTVIKQGPIGQTEQKTQE